MRYEIWKDAIEPFKRFSLTKDEKLELIQILKRYFDVDVGNLTVSDEASFCGEIGSKLHKL
jgi:hypothetical protein